MLSGAALATPSLNQMRSVTPDEAHLFSARPTARDFSEFRAGAFMGASWSRGPLSRAPSPPCSRYWGFR